MKFWSEVLTATLAIGLVLGSLVPVHSEDYMHPVPVYSSEQEKMYLAPIAKIKDPSGHGSGFFISPSHVVTARHVVEGLGSTGVYVYDQSGKRHRVLKVDMSYDADVALITVGEPNKDQPVAVIDCRMPNRFETLVGVGHPLAVENVTSPLMVVGYTEERDLDDVTSLVVAGATDPGMSGGPLYALDGKVVGVHSSRTLYGEGGDAQVFSSNFTHSVPLVEVSELCPKAQPGAMGGETAAEGESL